MKNQSTASSTTISSATITIKLANFASKANCSVLRDANGDVCLLERYQNEDGMAVVRLSPHPCDFHPEEKWLREISAGSAVRMIL